jgi:hypothetical protein
MNNACSRICSSFRQLKCKGSVSSLLVSVIWTAVLTLALNAKITHFCLWMVLIDFKCYVLEYILLYMRHCCVLLEIEFINFYIDGSWIVRVLTAVLYVRRADTATLWTDQLLCSLSTHCWCLVVRLELRLNLSAPTTARSCCYVCCASLHSCCSFLRGP